MCGRYSLSPHRIGAWERQYFQNLECYYRYNVAPSQEMPIARLREGKPEVVIARWGLIPYWAKDPKIGFSTINARAETVATKPAFRDAYQRRRCLVPASGYYEWQRRPGGRQPYYFTSRDGGLLAFAGLWERWRPKAVGGDPITSYTIIVCEPNRLAAGVHDRMPVIVPESEWQRWLGGEDIADLLKPVADDCLRVYPVSTAVNSTDNEGPELIEPIRERREPSRLSDLEGPTAC